MRSRSVYQHFSQCGAYATISLAFVIPAENHESKKSKPKQMDVGDSLRQLLKSTATKSAKRHFSVSEVARDSCVPLGQACVSGECISLATIAATQRDQSFSEACQPIKLHICPAGSKQATFNIPVQALNTALYIHDLGSFIKKKITKNLLSLIYYATMQSPQVLK